MQYKFLFCIPHAASVIQQRKLTRSTALSKKWRSVSLLLFLLPLTFGIGSIINSFLSFLWKAFCLRFSRAKLIITGSQSVCSSANFSRAMINDWRIIDEIAKAQQKRVVPCSWICLETFECKMLFRNTWSSVWVAAVIKPKVRCLKIHENCKTATGTYDRWSRSSKIFFICSVDP